MLLALLTTTFVELPSATETIASSSEWAIPLFNTLKPFLFIAIGIIVTVGLVVFAINLFKSIF